MNPDVFNPQCGSREVLGLIADRWSALILYALQGRTLRHAELRRALGSISQKMLTQTLRSLEAHGLVERQVRALVPPHVEYSLTELGASLAPILRKLCRWAEEYLPRVREVRRAPTG